jgi:hypothetical protein
MKPKDHDPFDRKIHKDLDRLRWWIRIPLRTVWSSLCFLDRGPDWGDVGRGARRALLKPKEDSR